MSESEAAKVAGRLQRRDVEATWHDAVNEAIELLHATISNWPADKEPPLHELADEAQVLSEIAELERQLAEARDETERFDLELNDVRAELAERTKHYEDQVAHRNELERELGQLREDYKRVVRLLGESYVAREVPWTDVAAGMMTLSKEEHPRPWMVVEYDGLGTWVLQNGLKEFQKVPADDETVRVLEPYVTPEQAEALVASELGGRA